MRCRKMRSVCVRPLCGLLMVPVLLATLGCGGSDGPERADIFGTMTYEGKPVAYAQLQFTPDADQGHSGPQTLLYVRDGQFDSNGKGPTIGPHVLKVYAYDGVSTELEPEGKMLMPEYVETVDVKGGRYEVDYSFPRQSNG